MLGVDLPHLGSRAEVGCGKARAVHTRVRTHAAVSSAGTGHRALRVGGSSCPKCHPSGPARWQRFSRSVDVTAVVILEVIPAPKNGKVPLLSVCVSRC